ncbi:MAG: hypothetical protein RBR63_02545 [Methanosarcina vacuolata]|jgi:hypothetical protein|nr:hypothetical protein [Methanosarcina vacuolata]
MGNDMKLKYILWLWFYKYLPYTKDSKLIFEPYKGFIYDLYSIEDLEDQLHELDENVPFMSGSTFGQKEGEILYQINYFHYIIKINTRKWKLGERW